jgi:hypothetical protein
MVVIVQAANSPLVRPKSKLPSCSMLVSGAHEMAIDQQFDYRLANLLRRVGLHPSEQVPMPSHFTQ